MKVAVAFLSLLLCALAISPVSAAGDEEPLGKPRMDFRNGPLDPREAVENAALRMRSANAGVFVPYRIFVSKGTHVFNIFPSLDTLAECRKRFKQDAALRKKAGRSSSGPIFDYCVELAPGRGNRVHVVREKRS